MKGKKPRSKCCVVVLAGSSLRDSHQRRRQAKRQTSGHVLTKLQNSSLSHRPSLPLSLFACLWTQAFINNLFINMLGNTGGRWSEEERQREEKDRQREKIRGGYKLEGCVQTNISQCVRKCSLLIHFSETAEIGCGTDAEVLAKIQCHIILQCNQWQHSL